MGTLYSASEGWEFWLYEGKIFSVRSDNLGYLLTEGIPSKARYLCTQEHFDAMAERLQQSLFPYPVCYQVP